MAYTPSSFPGYDAAHDEQTSPASFGISSAVTLPAGARIISTSGHVGALNADGTMSGDLKSQIDESWRVRHRLVEAGPELTPSSPRTSSVHSSRRPHTHRPRTPGSRCTRLHRIISEGSRRRTSSTWRCAAQLPPEGHSQVLRTLALTRACSMLLECYKVFWDAQQTGVDGGGRDRSCV